MALYRETPKCPHCGEPTARAIYNPPPSPSFIGDTFSHWEFWLCECEGAVAERKKIQEDIKPIVKEYQKSLEKERKKEIAKKLKEKAENKIDLLPCPFCGSEAYVGKEIMATYWSVGCSECPCKFDRRFKTKLKAVKFWNKRNKKK